MRHTRWFGRLVIGLAISSASGVAGCGGRASELAEAVDAGGAGTEAGGGGGAALDAADGADAAEAGLDAAEAGLDEPLELASRLVSPVGIALDAQRVYFTDYGDPRGLDGRVEAVPKQGGALLTLVVGQAAPSGIAVAGGQLFWSDASVEAGSGALFRLPLAGGSPSVHAAQLTGPTALVAQGADLYTTSGDALVVLPVAGGPLTTLGPLLIRGGVSGIAADRDFVYTSWEITRFDRHSGVVTSLAPGSVAVGLASDGTFVYATVGSIYEADASSLVRVRVSDGELEILASDLPRAGGVAVDEQHVYWTQGGTYEARMLDGEVRRSPKTGGPSELIASAQPAPTAIVVDDQAVYWINQGTGLADGSVMRATK